MTALLDLPDVRQRVYRLSVAAYHRAGENGDVAENVELLRGFVITKMSKSPLHEFVCQKLIMLLMRLAPKGLLVRPERPLTLRDSEPEPDVSIVRGEPEDWVEAHPSTAELVIEVAVSSATVDLAKADIYAEAGIPEYWIILPEQRSAEVFRQPVEGSYRERTVVRVTGMLGCATIPEISFAIAEIFPKVV